VVVASGVVLSMSGIACGSLRRIDAAILLMDFCGYAALTERTEGAHMGTLVNEYFERIVPPVLDRGGELLKFMGDGVLATFSLKDLQDDMVCLTALNAAIGALNNVQEWNAEREASGTPAMELDVAA
jgi:adenylate cyclase